MNIDLNKVSRKIKFPVYLYRKTETKEEWIKYESRDETIRVIKEGNGRLTVEHRTDRGFLLLDITQCNQINEANFLNKFWAAYGRMTKILVPAEFLKINNIDV